MNQDFTAEEVRHVIRSYEREFGTTLTSQMLTAYADRIERAQAGVPDGWLTIETAPDDGTPHVRGLDVFSSTDGKHLYWDAVVGRIDEEDGLFYDLGGDVSGWAADDFTHWHPLAAAPQHGESK